MKKHKCTYKDHKSKLGKAWHFLAHEDTWLSFIADAILIIIIGKFLIYPAIGLALGTNYPIVAVLSSSMDHKGAEFDTWFESQSPYYDSFNITKEQFQSFCLNKGFKRGDGLIIAAQKEYKVGDIIVYQVESRPDPIIHRVVSTTPIQTKGDANNGQLSFEHDVSKDQIEGKAVFHIPYLGWVKVGFTELIKK